MTVTRTSTRRRPILVGLVGALILVPVACSSDDDPASGDADPTEAGTNDSESSDASDDAAMDDAGDGNTAAADDFPIPRPDGLLLDALADAGVPMEGQRQLYYDDADFDRVVAFYDEWTAGEGGWTRTDADGVVGFTGSDIDVFRMITITPGHDPGAQADGPVTFVLLVDNS